MAEPKAYPSYPPPSPPLPGLAGPAHSSYPSDLSLPQTVLPPFVPPTLSSTSLPPLPPLPPTPAAPPIIHFDPNVSEEEDDEDEEAGRPTKKRRAMPSAKVLEGAERGGEAKNEGAGDAVETGRRKIEIGYIQKKEKRHITFSKRKAGIMKKAYELATLTGTQVLLLVVSETGTVFTFTTEKFQPLVGVGADGNPSEGQRLIQACLALPPNDDSPYISPPLDGALFPLPPSAANRPFEPSANIHGGQITLRTRAHRPMASNPRVGPVKSRPVPIRIQSHPGALSLGSLHPLSPGVVSGLAGGEHPPLRLHDQLPNQLPSSPHRLQSFQHRHSPSREYTPSSAIQNGANSDPRVDQPRSAQEYAPMSSPYANPPLQTHSQTSRMDGYDYGMPSQQRSQVHPLQQHSQPPSERYDPLNRSPQASHLHLQQHQQHQQHQHQQHLDSAAQQQQSSPHLRQYSDDLTQEQGLQQQRQQQSIYQQLQHHAEMQPEEYLAMQGRR